MAGEQYAPPSGPPPRRRQDHSSDSKFAPPAGPPPSRRHQETFTPPSGPPPSRPRQETFAPPPGPPPSRHHQETFAPPPGPPPKHTTSSFSSTTSQNPPPNNDWTIIPDTALLPPPPTLHHITSPTANASETEADRAHGWCQKHPLFIPRNLSHTARNARRQSNYLLERAREFTGHIYPLSKPGTYKVKATERCADCCLTTALPLYAAVEDSPLETEVPRTVYFEVVVERLGNRHGEEVGIAVGFVAAPYPTWRLPGWERGSLGVHGDDGRRYVNDTYGGKDFTGAFREGETVGIGMRMEIPSEPPTYGEGSDGLRLKVEVFFTRNGKREGGWDVHEEKDRYDKSGRVEGLEGMHDLCACVGMFGGSEFRIVLNPAEWKYHPA
ncbi:MAG: hypothetical protein M1821_001381 [Bathelium mastoideum]|nr:MAG: hypothetical protein M1821_001381 [Bathelium mastoideum]